VHHSSPCSKHDSRPGLPSSNNTITGATQQQICAAKVIRHALLWPFTFLAPY
jgi:hypothetical protein